MAAGLDHVALEKPSRRKEGLKWWSQECKEAKDKADATRNWLKRHPTDENRSIKRHIMLSRILFGKLEGMTLGVGLPKSTQCPRQPD